MHLRRAELSSDRNLLSITFPVTLANRGGRMLIITPDGQRIDPAKDLVPARNDNTIIKALARAFR